MRGLITSLLFISECLLDRKVCFARNYLSLYVCKAVPLIISLQTVCQSVSRSVDRYISQLLGIFYIDSWLLFNCVSIILYISSNLKGQGIISFLTDLQFSKLTTCSFYLLKISVHVQAAKN